MAFANASKFAKVHPSLSPLHIPAGPIRGREQHLSNGLPWSLLGRARRFWSDRLGRDFANLHGNHSTALNPWILICKFKSPWWILHIPWYLYSHESIEPVRIPFWQRGAEWLSKHKTTTLSVNAHWGFMNVKGRIQKHLEHISYTPGINFPDTASSVAITGCQNDKRWLLCVKKCQNEDHSCVIRHLRTVCKRHWENTTNQCIISLYLLSYLYTEVSVFVLLSVSLFWTFPNVQWQQK